MPSTPPEGVPAPPDGSIPEAAASELAARPVSLYLHVPFCASRCGYCDFNTYTAAELGSAPGTSQSAYLDAVRAELDLAARTLAGSPPVGTVFFGGGTPTVLPSAELAGLLAAVAARFDLAPEAEITTEANPETVDQRYLAELVAAGFTRISFGMQSAAPHVLATLERRHTPGRVAQVVEWARAAGFASISLDLIYGTPGESLGDWSATVDAALRVEPDHVSAYSLIVEPGTRLAAQIARGLVPEPDEDAQADAYLMAEERLTGAGFAAYEVSNWAREGHACRHNLAYWRGDHWWGVGPGAHSHVAGIRWWNVRHPRDYTARLAAGTSPAQAREVLTPVDRRIERVLLELRLADGLPLEVLTGSELSRVPAIVESGLARLTRRRLVLTVAGRLLADAVIRDLLD